MESSVTDTVVFAIQAVKGKCMQVPGVLILGRREDTDVADLVFESGCTPVFRESIMSAIAALRRGRYAAAMVDCRYTAVDVLEFVLNVRDVDDDLPVLVLNGSELNPSILDALRARGAHVVEPTDLMEHLGDRVVAEQAHGQS